MTQDVTTLNLSQSNLSLLEMMLKKEDGTPPPHSCPPPVPIPTQSLTKLYEQQHQEWAKTLKSTTDMEDIINNSQLYPTPNTTFMLAVNELHSIIPLGRTAGALREGWTGIMRDHLRRVIPHTTWYFKRSAFSHPDTRKRAAPLFKCEAVCAERTCPNTIKMCATKSDPLRVTVKFGQGMCVHMIRKKFSAPTSTSSSRYSRPTKSTTMSTMGNTTFCLKRFAELTFSDMNLLKRPLSTAGECSPLNAAITENLTASTHAGTVGTVADPLSAIRLTQPYTIPSSGCTEIKRPVAVRLTSDDRKRSYNRLRSCEDADAPSAFTMVPSPSKRLKVSPPPLISMLSPTQLHNFEVSTQAQGLYLDHGITT